MWRNARTTIRKLLVERPESKLETSKFSTSIVIVISRKTRKKTLKDSSLISLKMNYLTVLGENIIM